MPHNDSVRRAFPAREATNPPGEPIDLDRPGPRTAHVSLQWIAAPTAVPLPSIRDVMRRARQYGPPAMLPQDVMAQVRPVSPQESAEYRRGQASFDPDPIKRIEAAYRLIRDYHSEYDPNLDARIVFGSYMNLLAACLPNVEMTARQEPDGSTTFIFNCHAEDAVLPTNSNSHEAAHHSPVHTGHLSP